MNELVLFIVSSLPIILLGMYIYKKDKSKEPIKLLIKLFLGGIISCFLVVIISSILSFIIPLFSFDTDKLNLLQLLFYVFIKIALVEEICKWLIIYIVAYRDNEYEEIYDMIVYSVFVALGFAFFENLLYVTNGGIFTGILRAISAVPGHVCDGIFMGYYLGLAKLGTINKRHDLKIKYFLFSIFIPMILHGIYDYCLFIGNLIFIIIFVIFVIGLFIMAAIKVKKISALKNEKFKDKFCPNCGIIVDSKFCPLCGRKNN